MSTILKFDFQKKKRKQLRFSEVNYLNYTKKTQFCSGVATTFSLKRGETRTWTHSTPPKATVFFRWLIGSAMFSATIKVLLWWNFGLLQSEKDLVYRLIKPEKLKVNVEKE